jgi:hypothetical protein
MNVREAQGKYPFHFWIEKAVVSNVDGKMVIEGVASTGNVDHDGERMSPEALKAMVDVVNQSGVPLRIEHSQKDNAIIGEVFEGWLDDRGAFHIKASLDPEHVASPILYSAITRGENYGLSVGGFVKRAIEEMVEGVGRGVKTFYDILLDEVSVTKHPSNYDAVGLKAVKSRVKPQSDYMEAFAKSIPSGEWKTINNYKLEGNNMNKKNKSEETETEETTKASTEMDTETEETKKSESETETETKKTSTETEETTKAVSRKEFNELTKMVGELGNSITTVLGKMAKAIHVEAKDERQPEKEKSDPEETQERAVSKAEGEAVDQRQPDEEKTDPEESATTKHREGQTNTEDDGDDLKGEREKKNMKESTDTETYDLTTVQRSIKRIKAVAKAMDTDTETETKTTKAEETETESRTTKSRNVPQLDEFAFTVADTIERMEKSLKNQGFQNGHVAKMVIESIRSNPAYQEDIKAMLRQPGQKRSVIMGTPFVKTRDGKMFKLTVEDHPSTKVEKSTDGKEKTFKEMWGKSYASVSNEE